MTVRIQLFAVARQLAGCDAVEVELEAGATVADLRRQLVLRVPALADAAGHFLFAINNQYAEDATPIAADAEVTCIPPVSGG